MKSVDKNLIKLAYGNKMTPEEKQAIIDMCKSDEFISSTGLSADEIINHLENPSLFSKIVNWFNEKFPKSMTITETSPEMRRRVENSVELIDGYASKFYDNVNNNVTEFNNLNKYENVTKLQDILKYVKVCYHLGKKAEFTAYIKYPTDDSMIELPNCRRIVSENGMLTNDEITHLLKSESIVIFDMVDVSQYSFWVNV